ncbi:MAG: hypothetical protein ACP6IS_01975 [Candidatus Asgardarchaeia archaeon]
MRENITSLKGIVVTKKDKVIGPRIIVTYPENFIENNKAVANFLWEKIESNADMKVGAFLQTVDPFKELIILIYPFKMLTEPFAICLYFDENIELSEHIKDLEFVTKTTAEQFKQGLDFKSVIKELANVIITDIRI